MGRQIIKQPNDKYAVWSSIVDDFIIIDATPNEIIKCHIEEAKETIKEQVLSEIEKLRKKEKPNYQFTLSFNDAIELIKENHGKDAESLTMLKDVGVI